MVIYNLLTNLGNGMPFVEAFERAMTNRSMKTSAGARSRKTHHVFSHSPAPAVRSAMPAYIGWRVNL